MSEDIITLTKNGIFITEEECALCGKMYDVAEMKNVHTDVFVCRNCYSEECEEESE